MARSNLKKEAEQKTTTSLPEQTLPEYSLPWGRLKIWLENKFPGVTFPAEGRIVSDKFVFNAPRALTTAEKEEISKDLREKAPMEAQGSLG